MGRKLKFHVQSEHLPRFVWDNPQPPITEDKVGEWTEGRYQVLLYLSRALVGSEMVEDFVFWVEEFLSFFFITVANLGPIPTTNEAPVPMDEIG